MIQTTQEITLETVALAVLILLFCWCGVAGADQDTVVTWAAGSAGTVEGVRG